MKHPNPGRPLDPKWKNITRCEFTRVLTWKERIQALLGYTIKLDMAIFSEWSPGKFSPHLDLKFSSELTEKKGKR